MTVLAYILILAGVLSALADCCDLGEKDSNGVFYPSGLLFLGGERLHPSLRQALLNQIRVYSIGTY